jgi:hypothetical protein
MCPDPRSQTARQQLRCAPRIAAPFMMYFRPLAVRLTFRADYAVPHLSPEAEFLDVIGTKV